MAFALLLALQGLALSRQSLVGDAPYHLLAGHHALAYGENRLNLEHPPLVKLVAALPLLSEDPLSEPITVDRVLEASQRLFDDPERLHRVRLASRGLVLLVFGLPFLAVCSFLGREVAGPRAGVILVLLCGLSIPVLPNLSILQTDTAAALGFTLTVLASLRYVRGPGASRAALVGLGAGLALAAKFSGVLVLPAVAVAWAAGRPAKWRAWLRDAMVIAWVAVGFVWATYAVANRGYDAEAGRDTIRRYCRGEALVVDDRMEGYERPLLAVERFSPSLAQWMTGFVGIRVQNEIGVYPTYTFGTLSSKGRWWYFPAVLLVKTPLVILLATLGAFFSFVGQAAPADFPDRQAEPALRRPRHRRVFLIGGVTAAVYLGLAMTSNYNLGVRHLLPILPLLYLPAAWWIASRPWRCVLVLSVLAIEAIALSPLWMSATNTWWLGRHNPTRFAFSIGDAEYRQNFVALAGTARRRGLEPLYVLYPQVSEQEILAYLPHARVAGPGTPLEPGAWYAVNVSLEQYLPAIARARPEDVRGYTALRRSSESWRPYLRRLAERGTDHGYVAATFHLYRLHDRVGTNAHQAGLSDGTITIE